MYKYLLTNTLLPLFCLLALETAGQQFIEMTDEVGFRSPGQNQGVSIADVNSDGLDDIFITRKDQSNLLYINKGEFRFEEQASSYGLDYSGASQAALWIDFDNDSDLDLFLTRNPGSNIMYENESNVFVDRTFELGLSHSGFVKSTNTVDIDNDGYLDLYISYFNEQNVLYKNIDGAAFINYTSASGVNDPGPSMGAVFFDFDNDGDQDLYQTHDANVANLLYENNGEGIFTDVSAKSNTDFAGFGMGVDAADLNNDGYLDLYITNLEENVLYINQKDGTFAELAGVTNTDDLGMGWGTFIFDCNNSGNQDIYLANESKFGVNGISTFKNLLYLNEGNLVFEEQAYQGGVQNIYSSYGAAYSDFDKDGLLDFVVANRGEEGNQIFYNVSSNANFVTFKLIGKESNHQAIGARVEVVADGRKLIREIKGGSGWISQNSDRLHFGLGTSEIEAVKISWPSGRQQYLQVDDLQDHNIIVEPSSSSSGPLVWTEPAFPSQNDDVTVYFDAKEGNGGLAGYEGTVYAHTGVITSNSTSASDWKHVQGTWGVAFPKTEMTDEGDDVYSIAYNISDFYGVSDGELVEKLAFVFRSTDGSVTGRAEGGGDIFLDVFPPNDGLFALVESPNEGGAFIFENDTLIISANSSQKAKLDLIDNDLVIFSDSITEFNFEYTSLEVGLHEIDFNFSLDGDTISIAREIYVASANFEQVDGPDNLVNGINYASDSTLIFKVVAPGKEYAFFLTYANDFAPDAAFRMNQSSNGQYFWIEVPSSYFGEDENAYTYLIDQEYIADPYSTQILDPFNDAWIPDDVKAMLPPYPSDRLTGKQVTVFDVEKVDFDWTDQDYVKPDKRKLVIYETLMRDFLADRNYKSLLDTLDYFEGLGITAIELMPVSEFEGNNSWGYNPSFHMALDKEYGSKEQFKAFINEAHNRGISVIIDVVYNHVFSQSPLAQLYWDDTNFRPTEENPWLNVTAKHPFNVGYDVNHESELTKEWVKQTLKYWIEDFHIDGFRFDLSKGFTQTQSFGDDVFRQYDSGRIAILKEYADFIWSLDEDNYVILEHFAANDEETELANYGMMLWGNLNHEFTEAAEGRSSSLDWLDYRERGWDDPHLVGYMESHDEERMMVRVLESGDAEGDYNTREEETALERMAVAAAIFYLVPGPKMLWQFGEMGYDFSINWCTNGTVNGCRLDPKPIKWDYLEDENRARLQDVVSNIIHLKTDYPTFYEGVVTFSDGNFFLKTLHFDHEEMDAVVMANYRVTNSDINPKFQYPGVWYEYFTGDSLVVEDTQEKLTHLPGEYRIYTSKRITPPNGFVTSTYDFTFSHANVFPNPAKSGQQIYVDLDSFEAIKSTSLLDNLGRRQALFFQQDGQNLSLDLPRSMPAGIYYLEIRAEGRLYNERIVVD